MVDRLEVQFREPFTQCLGAARRTRASAVARGAKLNVVDSCFRAPDEFAGGDPSGGGRAHRTHVGCRAAVHGRTGWPTDWRNSD